jgi:hypothetical protein
MQDKEKTYWEPESDAADEAEVGFDPIQEVEDALQSPWILEQGPIFDKPLDDLLTGMYSENDAARTGIKFIPVGLLSFWRRLKSVHKKSLKTIQYHNSRHGYSIAVHDERIKQLCSAYTKKCREAETESNVVALRQLEAKEAKIEFVNPMSYATSIILPKDMEGCLSSLSAALGVSNVKLYCWLCILSLLTVKMDSGFKPILQKEADNFWDIVMKRLKGLE